MVFLSSILFNSSHQNHLLLGADSIIFMLECQQWYVANCLSLLASSPSKNPTLSIKKVIFFIPKPHIFHSPSPPPLPSINSFSQTTQAAMEKFIKEYDETVKTLSYAGSCTSWYRIGGSGRIVNNCHLSGVGYWWKTLWVKEEDIEVK